MIETFIPISLIILKETQSLGFMGQKFSQNRSAEGHSNGNASAVTTSGGVLGALQ